MEYNLIYFFFTNLRILRVVEALVALCTVKFCKEMSFYDIILEEDALQIATAVKLKSKN